MKTKKKHVFLKNRRINALMVHALIDLRGTLGLFSWFFSSFCAEPPGRRPQKSTLKKIIY